MLCRVAGDSAEHVHTLGFNYCSAWQYKELALSFWSPCAPNWFVMLCNETLESTLGSST